MLRHVKIRYFLSKIVKIRAMSQKKWLQVQWQPTPHFVPLWLSFFPNDFANRDDIMITGQECIFQRGIYIYWGWLGLDAPLWADTGPICWAQITGSRHTDRRTPSLRQLNCPPTHPNVSISSPTQLLCIGAFICLVSIQIQKSHQSNLPPLTPAHHLQVGCQSRNPAIFPSLHLAKSLCLGANGYLGQRRTYLEIV